jgi:hypothetical protein
MGELWLLKLQLLPVSQRKRPLNVTRSSAATVRLVLSVKIGPIRVGGLEAKICGKFELDPSEEKIFQE